MAFKKAVTLNEWVRFDHALKSQVSITRTLRIFSDAAGSPPPWIPSSSSGYYGMGGISWEMKLAWQMPKKVYNQWLANANDTQSNPNSINSEELTAQLMSLWLIKKFRTNMLYKAILYSYVDNSGVDVWIEKSNAKHAFQSKLLCLRSFIEMTFKCKVIPVWIPSKEMVVSRADALSRFKFRQMLGIKVIKINRTMFRQFTADVELAYSRM